MGASSRVTLVIGDRRSGDVLARSEFHAETAGSQPRLRQKSLRVRPSGQARTEDRWALAKGVVPWLWASGFGHAPGVVIVRWRRRQGVGELAVKGAEGEAGSRGSESGHFPLSAYDLWDGSPLRTVLGPRAGGGAFGKAECTRQSRDLAGKRGFGHCASSGSILV